VNEPHIRQRCRTLVRWGATDPWLVALAQPAENLASKAALPFEIASTETLLVRDLTALREYP
jgi:hypothetical protein